MPKVPRIKGAAEPETTTMTSYTSDAKGIGFVQSNEKYLRLRTLINHTCYEVYCKLFLDPNYGGFSRQPDTIYRELSAHREAVETLRNNGEISEADFLAVYPPSEETYLRECSLPLLHKLCQVCVKTFPRVVGEVDEESNHRYTTDDNNTYILLLEKLQSIVQDSKLQQRLAKSPHEFDAKWKEVVDLLRKLGYDCSKVGTIKAIDNLDQCRLCHVGYMRAQAELLSAECANLLKTAEVNTITLNRLITNLKAATSLEGKKVHGGGEEELSPLKDMKELKEAIEATSEVLHETQDSVHAVFGELKLWKEKNIEGDLIILDESLNKSNEEVSKQSRSVSHCFNTVSFDIVKIKEKFNSQMDPNSHVKHVKPHNYETEGKDKKINLGFASIGLKN